MQIHPYFRDGQGWIFDDPATMLFEEGLVDGMDQVLDLVTEARGLNKYNGFDVEFSDTEIPHDYLLIKLEEINGDPSLYGTYYMFEPYNIRGWLCPNLGRYFDKPPEQIFLKVVTE